MVTIFLFGKYFSGYMVLAKLAVYFKRRYMENNKKVLTFRSAIALVLCILCLSYAHAQEHGKRLLLGISKTDHKLVVMNPVTLLIIARISIGRSA